MRATGLYPRLVVSDGDRALAFYRDAFGATEVVVHRTPDGRIVHAELSIDGFSFYVKDADRWDADPTRVGGTPVILSLYTDDSDAMFASAVRAGADVVFPLATQVYGERAGRIRDPFGHLWIVSTIVERLTPEEIDRRMAGETK